MVKILIVEDAEEVRDIVKTLLKRENGVTIHEATSLKEASLKIKTLFPDIIVLDLNLPDGSGTSLCKTIRSKPDIYGEPSIIALTADISQESVNNNLTLGCDDYIKKPFDHNELVIRMKKYINQAIKQGKYVLTHKSIKIEMNKKEVVFDGNLISLSKNEFSILEYFIINKGILLSKPKILNHIWNDDLDVSEKAIDQCLKRLRKKIPPLKEDIISKRGFGYMLK